MSKVEILNSVDHGDLKIITERSEASGDGYMCVPTFPREFRSVQAHYPIVFSKNKQSGDFTPLALLGLEDNENLFLREGVWDANYIPLCAEAKPFLIGSGQQSVGDEGPQWSIHVDMSSPKLSREKGLPLFKEFGGNSEFVERMGGVLSAIHDGIGEVKPFTDLLVKLDLLESFAVETTLKNGQKANFTGFYVINEDRLANLSKDELLDLHASAYLFDIYMLVASLSHFQELFVRKHKGL
jgi:hypothetical protein